MAFVRRDEFLWRLRTRSLALGRRTLVMGVLNVTPDSFSDGGRFAGVDAAVAEALRMFEDGADIVDIGGESTRPGSHAAVAAEEEQQRVLPVIAAILKARPGSPLSIDTYKASTAEAAVLAGAEIVNDISGLAWDADMPAACGRLGCGVVLMHTRGRPEEWRTLPPLPPDEVLPLVEDGLRLSLTRAAAAGMAEHRIVLDPGYGFGKSFDENYPLLAHQDRLGALGHPILAGVSRKSFLGHTISDLHGGRIVPTEQRATATLAAITASVLAGAHIVRVHAVRPAVEAARIADAILAAL